MQKRRPLRDGAVLLRTERPDPTKTRTRLQANGAMRLRLQALLFLQREARA